VASSSITSRARWSGDSLSLAAILLLHGTAEKPCDSPAGRWNSSSYASSPIRRHLGVRLTPHKPRHAYGKHCVDRGVDIRIIAEALRHESLESTKIYTQVSFERTRRIAELFALPGV
jgi:integrase